MSNEIFKWQPHMLDVTSEESFNVVKVQFENDMVQRGLTSQRESNMFSFTYKNKLSVPSRTSKLSNEIKTFWKARQGTYDNFFLPSWELEGKFGEAILADNATIVTMFVGDTSIYSATASPADLGFSQTLGDAGNYIYLCERFPRDFEVTTTHEIRRIVSWAYFGYGVYRITTDDLTGSSVNIVSAYTTNAYIQKAYKVFFDMDGLPRTMAIPDAVEYTINFKEDLASLYQNSFGGF